MSKSTEKIIKSIIKCQNVQEKTENLITKNLEYL